MKMSIFKNQPISNSDIKSTQSITTQTKWSARFPQSKAYQNVHTLCLDELLDQFHTCSNLMHLQSRSITMLSTTGLFFFTLFNASVLLYTLASAYPTVAGIELIVLIGLNLLLLIIAKIPLLLLKQYRTKQMLRSISNALSEIENVRVIGPLLESLPNVSSHSRQKLEAGLEHSFANLCSPCITLTKVQKTVMKDILHSPDPLEIQFKIQLLKVVPFLGDETFIPIVENLTFGRSTKLRNVRIAARECLPSLMSRAKQLKVSRLLLKPSSRDEQSLLHVPYSIAKNLL